MTESVPNKTINWGIIGLGNIANKFAKDLLTIENANLYAVASRSSAKANEFAQQYNATKAYECYEDLAEDPNIDAVYIATPHVFHKENTLLCLENNIAVLCEKPFAMDAKEVDTMIAKAKEKKVLLMEALWTYFLPHYRFVLRTLENKTYGNILKLEADFGFKSNHSKTSRVWEKSLGGGSLLDIGIYPVFTALSTLGNPNTIKANAIITETGVDSTCEMTFNYTPNIKAFLESSFIEDTPTEAIFYCKKATIKINTQFHCPTTVTITEANGEEKTIDFNYKTIGYNYEIEHFNSLLRAQKTESDIMTFQFSKQLIKTLDGVRKIINLHY
ncbi:Gfo/Idh/MocA family oxidoreductase [Sabulilitoribacter arenilitoris]|uniref:Gfo/Idh/MocA family oxidoreductase n=1 Tax=Wocania arenilitoris TaxID=2044858 RepID=A0AAE3EMG9_9FLAO|nr:Gfo/Idh/MocA family oxidoreductase [Wocania arenilitoris]MCF7568111.1 Gfo/Idh/MocA family oxidoreductase [Wocania arenilitoris]